MKEDEVVYTFFGAGFGEVPTWRKCVMMKLSRPEVANQELQFPRFLMPSDSFHAASTGQREGGRGAQRAPRPKGGGSAEMALLRASRAVPESHRSASRGRGWRGARRLPSWPRDRDPRAEMQRDPSPTRRVGLQAPQQADGKQEGGGGGGGGVGRM